MFNNVNATQLSLNTIFQDDKATLNSLRRAKIAALTPLLFMSVEELGSVRYIGKRQAAHITDRLWENGLEQRHLGESIPSFIERIDPKTQHEPYYLSIPASIFNVAFSQHRCVRILATYSPLKAVQTILRQSATATVGDIIGKTSMPFRITVNELLQEGLVRETIVTPNLADRIYWFEQQVS